MKKRILVVDDEIETLQFLKRHLERNNFTVLTARSGLECLTKASQEDCDLILLDILMPFMDGYEVIKQLRRNSKTRHIPIILHTVVAETPSIFKGLALGSIDYVIKPITFKALLKVIERWV